MEDFEALAIDGHRPPRNLDLDIVLFKRLVLGLHLSTELFYIEDQTTLAPRFGTVRYYSWLHIGPARSEKQPDLRIFEIALPFVLIGITVLPKDQ